MNSEASRVGITERNTNHLRHPSAAVTAALVLLLAAGCAAQRTRPPATEHLSAARLLRTIVEKSYAVRSVRGVARVHISTPRDDVVFRQVTVLQHPDTVHLEALSAFGTTMAVLDARDGNVTIRTPRETVSLDARRAIDLSTLYPPLPLRASVEEVVALLGGRVPGLVGVTPDEMELKTDGDLIVLVRRKTEQNEGGTATVRRLWVEPRNLRPAGAEVAFEGGLIVRLRYGDFVSLAGGGSFPRRIEVESERFSITIKYAKDTELGLDTVPGPEGEG